ncbi:MAG: DivIVA domain-containing protein, partial [Clostridia bacterium]|nr:DivIVA domain-containing protein [Clostridia bacterium]
MLPPHELKNKSFTKALRGYNPVEVDEYIDFLIEKYTELYRENDELEHKLKAAAARLDELKTDEEYIRSTLVDAKRAANKIKSDAEGRAEEIVRSAKASCNTILSDFNDKIEYGRETLAELQRDAFALKRELFERYSEHIQFIEKLTEGMDEDSIPETSEMRRKAVSELKSRISNTYSVPENEDPIETDESDNIVVDEPIAKPVEFVEELPLVPPTEEELALEISREPLAAENAKSTLKGSIMELNRQYKET